MRYYTTSILPQARFLTRSQKQNEKIMISLEATYGTPLNQEKP